MKMKKITLLILLLAAKIIFAQSPKTVVKTGENFITLNGERFHNEKIILKPHLTGYDNEWNEYGKEKFTDINLIGKYHDRYLEFQLTVPGQIGTYTIEDNRNAGGSQNNDNNCRLLIDDKITYTESLDGETGSVKVIVTRYDKVGGLIEGNFTGTLVTDTKKNTTISISGKFSVIRNKNRIEAGAVPR